MSDPAEGKHPDLLPWYVAGTLEAEEARQVRDHLDACSECRIVAEATAAMVRALSQNAAPTHVRVEDLVVFEAAGPEDEPDLRSHVEAHLLRCAACRQDLAQLRLVRREESARGQEEPSHGRPPFAGPRWTAVARRLRWPFAAALAAALIAFVLITEHRKPPPASEGLVFTPRSRGDAGRPALRAPGPWSVQVVLPYSAPRGMYRARVETEGGSIAGRMEGPFSATAEGILMIQLPPIERPGSYFLFVESLEAPVATIHVYPFVIVSTPSSG